MASIKTTGNADIDTATAEIAVALRDASAGTVRGPYPDQRFYDEAMRLRDQIMAGTRNLDELRRFGTTVEGYQHPQPVKQFPAPTYGQRQPMGDDDSAACPET